MANFHNFSRYTCSKTVFTLVTCKILINFSLNQAWTIMLSSENANFEPLSIVRGGHPDAELVNYAFCTSTTVDYSISHTVCWEPQFTPIISYYHPPALNANTGYGIFVFRLLVVVETISISENYRNCHIYPQVLGSSIWNMAHCDHRIVINSDRKFLEIV